MKIITYTAAMGELDAPRTDVDYCFTDRDFNLFKDSRRNARAVKCLPHLFLPDHDYSIWIDANVELKTDPKKLVDMLPDRDIGAFLHCERHTLFAEAKACVEWGKDQKRNIRKALKMMEGEDHLYPLAMTFLLVRGWEEAAEYGPIWHSMIMSSSVRDQLTFTYAHHIEDKELLWPAVPLTESEYFIRHPHGTVIS